MLYLHQILTVAPPRRAEIDARLRDDWLPAVARDDGARLAWVASSMDCGTYADEICTFTVLRDPAALARHGERVRTGDLSGLAVQLADSVVKQELRLMKPLRYNPFTVNIDDIPTAPVDAPTVSYMHDFVPPCLGQNRGYEDMMEQRYMALSEKELSGVVLYGAFETAAGAGPMPEHFNLSKIRSTDALIQLLAHEIPKEYKAMGSWMWEALGVRDRWTTRLVRCASWSPVR
jgi:hypothetical protein